MGWLVVSGRWTRAQLRSSTGGRVVYRSDRAPADRLGVDLEDARAGALRAAVVAPTPFLARAMRVTIRRHEEPGLVVKPLVDPARAAGRARRPHTGSVADGRPRVSARRRTRAPP